MRVLGATVLSLEAIVVILAIPLAIVVQGVTAGVAIPAGVVLALALIVLARYVTRSWAVPVGWALQVVVVLAGLVVPMMFIVGGIFALLWGAAIRLGRQVDQGSGSAELPPDNSG